MNGSKMTAALMALMMGVATVASAQPRDDRHRDGPQEHGRMEGPPPRAERGFEHGPDRGPGGGPEHSWHRGDRIPAEWRGRQYVVDDWRGHHLSAPPRGYHWVQAGADFALVAITTGIITSLIVNSQ